MPYRLTPFVNQSCYHIYNRGVNKQNIYGQSSDYTHFLKILNYYQYKGPKPSFSQLNRFKLFNFTSNPKIIEIICYCLMPNHFHLLLKQTMDGGIQELVRKSLNSYTKYFNTKSSRSGPLLTGEFKSVLIESDEQLLHVSRYIHLNPYVNGLTKNIESYPYSSYPRFIKISNNSLCFPSHILNYFKSTDKYRDFVSDHSSYAKDLEYIKHLLIEPET